MTDKIKIFRTDGELVYEVTPNERCKRFYQLMGDDYITLDFLEAYRPSYPRPHGTPAAAVPPPAFHIGDYCEIDGERYVINEKVKPTYNSATGAYSYSMRMVAEYRTWCNYVVKEVVRTNNNEYKVGGVVFKYTTTLRNHAKLLLQALAVNGVYDSEEIANDSLDKYISIHADHFTTSGRDKENKLMAYNGQNVLEAIETLCSEEMYDCEWWVTRIGRKYVLHFGRLENADGTVVDIRIGENASNITEEQSKNEYANRIFVLGGTQNVPYSYRKKLLFTNTAETNARITDAGRPLRYDMFKNGHRETKYDCDVVESAKTYAGLHWGLETDRMVLAEAEELPKGVYTIAENTIRSWLVLDDYKENGYLKFARYTIKGYANVDGKRTNIFTSKSYGADIKRYTKALPTKTVVEIGGEEREVVVLVDANEAKMAKGSESSTNMDEVEFVLAKDVTDVSVVLEIEYRLDLLLPIGKKLDFFIEHRTCLQRRDLYVADCVVRNYATGRSSAAEFRESIHEGWNEIVPEVPRTARVNKGVQYMVEGLIYNKVKQHYYTSDKGEDVINGLSEMRLNLPEDADMEDGYRCENGYVEKTDTGEATVEKMVVHDDIFPSEVSMIVQGYETDKRPAKMTFSDSSVAEREYDVYIIKDTYIHNEEENKFSKDYILDGATLQVKFKTGALAGMTFDVEFGAELPSVNNEETEEEILHPQTYLVIPNTNYGALIPNETMHPEIGDEMLLLGWDCNAIEGLGMIAKAEEMLLAAALDDLEAATKGSRTFSVDMAAYSKFEEDILCDVGDEELRDAGDELLTTKDVKAEIMLQAGQRVILTDYALFGAETKHESGPLRVVGYETAIDYPFDRPKYIVGEIPKPTRRERLESITKQLKKR